MIIAAWIVFAGTVAGAVFAASRRNSAAVVLWGLGAVLALAIALGLGNYAQQQNKEAQAARVAHLHRLAWQKAHPTEYAAQVKRARANIARQVAEKRAERQRQQARQRETQRVANLPENRDPCEYASGRIEQGWSDFKGGAYQSAFDDATKGLAVNDRCDNDDAQQVNQGFLLSIKGMSEHYLSSGDSRTDLHQAETVLEECQTNPRFYGTHTGAECETQQENDIQSTTNWDVYGS